MPPEVASIATTQDGLRRFNRAVQRSRGTTFLITFLVFVVGRVSGVISGSVPLYALLTVLAVGSAWFFHALYARGIDRRLPFPLHRVWMAIDVIFLSISIPLTGGLDSPWYIWQLSNVAAAAFVCGRRAMLWVSAANIAGYVAILAMTGQLTNGDALLLVAFRMLFLYGAASITLLGIAAVQEKRAEIVALREAEQKKFEELTRLASELDQRTQELARANMRIREADRAKSQFLANMSHELRTPMNSIIGFSEILIERLHDQITPRYNDFLHHILSSGQHLLAIINDVLDLSKIEAGKMQLFPESFEIPLVMAGVAKVMHAQATEKDIQFELDTPPDLPPMESDLAKFKQVLFNLVSNAVKFSPQHSVITIRARHNDDDTPPSITVSVIDRGIGIAPEHHEMVFEEFRQIDDHRRKETSGTGLGLALVKRFVELQHGRVALESTPGSGSCFSFTLPVTFQGSRDALDIFTEERALYAPGDRVLVVEDDPIAYEAIAAHLASAGYVPVRARHGEEALRLARSIHPVAITLDLVLPGVDGWEVLKQLKSEESLCDIPVVVISMVDSRELGLALGAHDYFLKPVDRGKLVDRLRQFTAAPLANRARLLVIDEDVQYHELLDEDLRDHGYILERAYNGEDGVEMATRTLPTVVILDLMMPGMSGFEVAELLKRNHETAKIPILVLTSKDISSEERQRLQNRISAFVPKGQSKARLLGALHDVERLHARAQLL
jgi:signal transduction histidine kinase/CheY-like chemotaxis protein